MGVQKRSSYLIGSFIGRSYNAGMIRCLNSPGLMYILMHWGLDGSRYMSLSAFFLCLLSCLEALTSQGLKLMLSDRGDGTLESVGSRGGDGCGRKLTLDKDEIEEGVA